MNTLHIIVLGFLTGAVTAHYAKQQKRNPFLWFGIGFFFGLLGLLFLFITFARRKKRPALQRFVLQSSSKPAAPNNTVHPLEGLIPAECTSKLWYYLNAEHQQQGPMSFQALQEAWDRNALNKTSYVWNESMEDWKTVEDLNAPKAEAIPVEAGITS